MTKKKKLILYGIVLFMGLLSFILQIFVFQKPNGTLGFAICVIIFESNQWEFIFEMVANGQGISILPKPLVDKFNNDRVHQIHLESPVFPWTLSLIRKKDKHISSPCRCFWNMCERENF